MTKTTIELDRMKRHWSGWGVMFDKWTEQDSPLVLDALVKWSTENPGTKVYRHTLWVTEENVDKDETLVKTLHNSAQPIHYCDRVAYLDIYWQ